MLLGVPDRDEGLAAADHDPPPWVALPLGSTPHGDLGHPPNRHCQNLLNLGGLVVLAPRFWGGRGWAQVGGDGRQDDLGPLRQGSGRPCKQALGEGMSKAV